MTTSWPASERLRLINELAALSGADSQAFFDAHSLGRAYRSAGQGSSKKARVSDALYAAEQRGDLDDILDAAEAYLNPEREGNADEREALPHPNIRPRPATPLQKALLQAVWDFFFLNRRWPAFQDVDRKFDRLHGRDIIEVARDLPKGLVAPSDPRSWSGDQELKLSLAGAAACDGSAELVRLFLDAVQLAVRIEAEHPDEGTGAPTLTPDLLRAADSGVLLPAAGRSDTLARLGHLLAAESWGHNGWGWSAATDQPEWHFTVGREVRRLRPVRTIDDYWNVIHPAPDVPLQLHHLTTVVPEVFVTEPEPQTIFLVHGHDDARYEVARFLEKSTPQAQVVMLGEQPSRSQTVIEKFEKVGNTASFAVVLLTPDDLGKSKIQSEFNPRARQNVVLELGYFFGKLGRAQVAVLNKGVEPPSDVNGLVYIEYPNGPWKIELARELQAAGFDSDPTNA